MNGLKTTKADDGRTLVTCEGLSGFYFVLYPGEDPYDTLLPTLNQYLRILARAQLDQAVEEGLF